MSRQGPLKSLPPQRSTSRRFSPLRCWGRRAGWDRFPTKQPFEKNARNQQGFLPGLNNLLTQPGSLPAQTMTTQAGQAARSITTANNIASQQLAAQQAAAQQAAAQQAAARQAAAHRLRSQAAAQQAAAQQAAAQQAAAQQQATAGVNQGNNGNRGNQGNAFGRGQGNQGQGQGQGNQGQGNQGQGQGNQGQPPGQNK